MGKICSSLGYVFVFTFILGALGLVLHMVVLYFNSVEGEQDDKRQYTTQAFEKNFSTHSQVPNVITGDSTSLSPVITKLHVEDATLSDKEDINNDIGQTPLTRIMLLTNEIRKETTQLLGLLDAGKNYNVPTLHNFNINIWELI